MSSLRIRTEDEVRDGYTSSTEFVLGAKQILEFDKPEKDVEQGTGQIKTFKQLSFNGDKNNHKPDGWYLPKDTTKTAIILETKAEDKDLSNEDFVNELLTNVKIANLKYKKVVGILYNGKEQRIFLNDTEMLENVPPVLQPKSYYVELFDIGEIDRELIFNTTRKINNLLHFKFGVNNLYDRMVFTACALVAKSQGAKLDKGMDFEVMQTAIITRLRRTLEPEYKKNEKLRLLEEMYSKVQMNITNNQEAIDKFIESIETISNLVNSSNWNGEDVMGIFFKEFNRYKPKSENGQVFTPEHIVSFMYRLIDVNLDDKVLDAACGSGAFLVKAMSNMIKQAGGIRTQKAQEIMSNQLYGIEIDKSVFSLACANMLLHKDGKTNIVQMDTLSEEACNWIKDKGITKVLMNPPYEKKYHPELIVKNVLDNIPKGAKAAFLLPDKKLEKVSQKVVKDILKTNRLTKIIKLPEKTFDEGVTVSIFIFECGIPQNNEEIFTCYIKEDGLERIKNQGRQDVRHKWKDIENEWVRIINRQTGSDTIKWIKPSECLSYQVDRPPFELYEEDFIKTMTNYIMFKREIDVKELKEALSNKVIYYSDIDKSEENNEIYIKIQGGEDNE